MKNINLKKLDKVSKVVLIVLVVAIGYFLIFLVMGLIWSPTQTPMMNMMNNNVIGANIMSFSTLDSIIINLVSLAFALGSGFFTSLYLFKAQSEDKDYTILRKVLSDDEKMILDEVKKAGEITQDSLRFRLNWSKAKVSTTLTLLDKMNLIQRERIGKTYKVYLQRELG